MEIIKQQTIRDAEKWVGIRNYARSILASPMHLTTNQAKRLAEEIERYFGDRHSFIVFFFDRDKDICGEMIGENDFPTQIVMNAFVAGFCSNYPSPTITGA